MSNTIKLSKETLATLNKASQLNPCLKIKAHEKSITTSSSTSGIIMSSPVEEDFPREINIYDLKMFLKTLTLVSDPVLDFSSSNSIIIESSDLHTKTCFREANPDLIQTYVDPTKIPTFENETVVDCEIPQEVFEHVMKAARTLGHNYIGLIGDGSVLSLSAFNLLDSKEMTDMFSNKITDCESTFSVIFKLEVTDLTSFMNEGDLRFRVSKRGASLVNMRSGKFALVVIDNNSSFEGV